MNSTSILPAYSFFSSSRIGAIFLHGMHLPAPRSISRGTAARGPLAAGASLGSLLLCLRATAATTVTASAATIAILAGVFITHFDFRHRVSYLTTPFGPCRHRADKSLRWLRSRRRFCTSSIPSTGRNQPTASRLPLLGTRLSWDIALPLHRAGS